MAGAKVGVELNIWVREVILVRVMFTGAIVVRFEANVVEYG